MAIYELVASSTAGALSPVALPEGEFRIGGDASNHVQLPGLAATAASITRQGNVVWVEASGNSVVAVNGQSLRRLALRADDCIQLGEFQIEFRVRQEVTADASRRSDFTEATDLSLLSAEELCDRIAAEEAMIEQFEARREFGFAALLDAARQESRTGEIKSTQGQFETSQASQNLVAEIEQLSDILAVEVTSIRSRHDDLVQVSREIRDVQTQLQAQLNTLGQVEEPSQLRATA